MGSKGEPSAKRFDSIFIFPRVTFLLVIHIYTLYIWERDSRHYMTG